ncbi:hypothetical protein DXG01_009144 [Tephrocybe rancida]|nr:hypothetical protein DXG01_009144 [Tephrocybe rancida]
MPSQKPLARGSGVRPLKAVVHEDVEIYDSDSDCTLYELLPSELDEAWPYTFEKDEAVWVKAAGGNWCSGHIVSNKTRTGPTRQKEGMFYQVQFMNNKTKIRKYFAPLNGEVKPDSAHTQRLLKEAGWLA